MGLHLDGHGEVVEESAGRPVRRVDGTDESPGVGQQRPHLRRPHLLEEGAPVDGPEVRHVAHPVDVLRHDGHALVLHQAQPGLE